MKFIENLSEKCALPAEALANTPLIQICGRSIRIENHKGILQYGPEEVQVRLKRGTVRVQGSELKIAVMNRNWIELCGTIRCVELE